MQVEWDVEIPTGQGARTLRADVFRPAGPGPHPVLLSHGVYGKGVPVAAVRRRLLRLGDSLPDTVQSSDVAEITRGEPDGGDDVAPDDFRVWEVVDPLRWVPAGYACVRVDSQGSGASPGRLDPLSPGEIDDFERCIEWAGTQEWSSGRVGLCGKSYYAMTQWLVAARRPEHLAAICVWHGLSDLYRDGARHGGILYRFWEDFWYPHLVLPVQHGVGPQAGADPHTGRPFAGEQELGEEQLAAARRDLPEELRRRPVIDDFHRERTPDLAAIDVPLLAAADWTDQDLHLRGTIEGFLSSGSPDRRLEVHATGEFDDDHAVALQRRLFDHVLLDRDSGWTEQPPVQLAVREVDGTTTTLDAEAWPVPGTTWREAHLDLAAPGLTLVAPDAPGRLSYAADGDGVVLETPALAEETLLLGPVAATLFVSASTSDADLFLTLEAVGPGGELVELRDHRGGLAPLSVGWLRASHRALDAERSFPWRPWHPHEAAEPLVPGEVHRLDVELRPTSLRVPAEHRLRLAVRGHGRLHDDPVDRPEAVFANTVTLHSGPETPSRLLLAVVPPEQER